MQPNYPLKAVLWDFDGTMADTLQRNLSVNRRIVEEILGRPWQSIPELASVGAYNQAWRRVTNWQKLYTEIFGLTESQCDQAAEKWAPYQLEDDTSTPLFDGLGHVIAGLDGLPQAIVSQNDSRIIEHIIRLAGIGRCFQTVIGYAEVPIDRQKPAPDGLLIALEALSVTEPASVLYIGDHETDMVFAANANRHLAGAGRAIRVISVAAHFELGSNRAGWAATPDHMVHEPSEIAQLVGSLSVDPH
jgi:HAD superfamily hydrolase (TIGR01549 family)